MARPSKDYEYFSAKLDRQVSERFSKFCKDTARNKTAALEMILTQYLDEYYKRHPEENKENS